MRSLVRPALLALALAATPTSAHAALGDGAENAGSGCHWAPISTTTREKIGVMTAGPWVAADLLENNGGVVSVDDEPALATSVTVTCTIYGTAFVRPVLFSTSATGAGVVVMEPRLIAFDTLSTPGEICTKVDWVAQDGPGTTGEKCLPV